MRLLIPLILLAFPFAEIFLLVKLAYAYGWWLFVYLVGITFLGLQLIRGEKLTASAKMMQGLSAGANPIKTILGSARNIFAGFLLIIPGVISDIIAVILLLIPIQQDQQQKASRQSESGEPDVIEGEFTHVKEDLEYKEDDKSNHTK